MTEINAVARYDLEGDVGVITLNSPPVNALSAGVRDGLAGGMAAAWPIAGAKAIVIDLRGPHLHRRRRHHRIRRRRKAAPACSTCRTRSRTRPSRWSPRSTAPRWAAAWKWRSALPLPRRGPVRPLRPAGGQPRPPARRRRHAAAAAHRRRREGAGDDDLAASTCRRRSAWRWASSTRSSPRASCRQGAVAFASKIAAEGGPLKKVRESNDKVEAARGHPEIFDELPQGQRPQVPRLPGAGIQHPLHRGGGERAVRRGAEDRTQAVRRADERARSRRRSATPSSPSARPTRSRTCRTTPRPFRSTRSASSAPAPWAAASR